MIHLPEWIETLLVTNCAEVKATLGIEIVKKAVRGEATEEEFGQVLREAAKEQVKKEQAIRDARRAS